MAAEVERNVGAPPVTGPLTTIVCPNKIGPYHLRAELGRGAFSIVRLAIHEETNEQFACKIVPKKRLMETGMETKFEQEVRILQKCRHPGICNFYNILKDTLNYYMILELCENGNLHGKIVQSRKLDEDTAKYIFKQLLLAMQYVHESGIAHRDLKPENVLIDEDNTIKIIDFGLSCFQTVGEVVTTRCGSPSYSSPECIKGSAYDAMKSDIWSLGVVLYTMLFGQLPWSKKSYTQQMDQIRRGEYFVGMSVSQDARDLICGMMEVCVDQRLSISDALKSPWFGSVKSSFWSREAHAASERRMNIHVDAFFEKVDESAQESCAAKINECRNLLAFARRRTTVNKKITTPKVKKLVGTGILSFRSSLV